VEEMLKVINWSLKDALTELQNAQRQNSILVDTLSRAGNVGSLPPILAEDRDVGDALVTAERAVKTLQGDRRYYLNKLQDAKIELADAEKALGACESGASLSVAHALSIDVPEACGGAQAALAAARARATGLALGAKRLEQTRLRPAGQHLHAAIAKLTDVLAQPAASAYRSQFRPVLNLLHKADTIMIGAVHQLDRLEKSAGAAAASVPNAKAALAKCQATPPPPTASISEDDTWGLQHGDRQGKRLHQRPHQPGAGEHLGHTQRPERLPGETR
jgi:hypothetical protein